MATTKIWPVRDSLKRVVDYASNPEKTSEDDLASVVGIRIIRHGIVIALRGNEAKRPFLNRIDQVSENNTAAGRVGIDNLIRFCCMPDHVHAVPADLVQHQHFVHLITSFFKNIA